MKRVEERLGNRFLVKFDRYELGMWHDEDGDPVLRLGENDLIPVDERYSAGHEKTLHGSVGIWPADRFLKKANRELDKRGLTYG